MPKQFKGPAKAFIDATKAAFIGQGANPNDIIVQDLFHYKSTEETNSLKGLLKGKGLSELKAMSQEDRAIIQSLLAVYNEHIQTKRDVLTQARNLFDTDIVQTVIDVMIDDGFNSFNNEKEEFKIQYILDDDDLEALGEEYQKQIQNEIDDFVSKFALKTKVAEIVPELLRDGEYAFGVLFDKNNKKGITEIVDDLDVINLLPFYENEKLAFVINQNHFDDNNNIRLNFVNKWDSMMDDNRPIAYKPDNIVFFRLKGPTKLRINMSKFYNSEFRKHFHLKTGIKLPKYVRTALPIYYSAMKTLNRLKIMENVSTVMDLMDILKPEIVHVSVPANTSPVEVSQIISDYERQLNDASGFADVDSFDVSSLAAMANRRKVLPQWLDNKGAITSAGINQSGKGQNAWDSIDKLRNLAALSIGIPPFYINISGTPIEKAQIIKLYSRYTRKLTSLQKTLADGIKDFLMIHLKHKGLNISRENLSVKFKAITSGDSLDDTDLMCSVITSIGDLYKALEEITGSDNNRLVLDDEQFKELFNDLTSRYLNIANLIKLDDSKFTSLGGGDEEGGFEPSGPSGGSHRSSEPNIDIDINNSTPPEMTSGPTAETAYDEFVDISNDIGVEGTAPAVEEI